MKDEREKVEERERESKTHRERTERGREQKESKTQRQRTEREQKESKTQRQRTEREQKERHFPGAASSPRRATVARTRHLPPILCHKPKKRP